MINILPILHHLAFDKNAAFFDQNFWENWEWQHLHEPHCLILQHQYLRMQRQSRLWAGLALYCPSNYGWAALNYVRSTSSQRQKHDQDFWGCTEASSLSFPCAPFHKEGRMVVESGSKPPVDSSPCQRGDGAPTRALVLPRWAEQASWWGWVWAHMELDFAVAR